MFNQSDMLFFSQLGKVEHLIFTKLFLRLGHSKNTAGIQESSWRGMSDLN